MWTNIREFVVPSNAEHLRLFIAISCGHPYNLTVSLSPRRKAVHLVYGCRLDILDDTQLLQPGSNFSTFKC